MSVKRILSSRLIVADWFQALIRQCCTCNIGVRSHKKLDNPSILDIIIFTGDPAHDLAARPPAKAPNPPQAPNAQSTTRSRYSHLVSKQRFLRPRRPAAGQVRDAAPGSRRSRVHQRSYPGFWVLPPLFLPGTIGVSAGRRLRLVSPQAGSARRSQANQRSNGLYPPAAIRSSRAHSGATGSSSSKTVPGSSASAQYSAAAAGGKKTTLKPTRSDALRYSYEDLRTQALHGGRGPGLAIFLHHGMCEWVEVCCSCTPVMAGTEQAHVPTNPECVQPETRAEIVSILAGLFLQKRWEARQ
jgi:lipoprotein-anchoring transpeptidase ErfK/SrfK